LWFSEVLSSGYHHLNAESDCYLPESLLASLPQLPDDISSETSVKNFCHSHQKNIIESKETLNIDRPHTLKPLLTAIVKIHGGDLFKTGVIKAILGALSFSSPLLLGSIVSYLETKSGPSTSNINDGVFLIFLLTISSILSTILNTNFNIRSWIIKVRLVGSLSPLIFERALSLPLESWSKLVFSEAQINNLIQIDVEQLSECFKSIHDVWALPLQIIVTFILLYLQIRLAFLAGVAVILLMMPINSVCVIYS